MNNWAKIGMLCSGIGAFCSLLAKDWLVMTVDVALFCTFVLDGFNGPKGPSQTGKGAPV